MYLDDKTEDMGEAAYISVRAVDATHRLQGLHEGVIVACIVAYNGKNLLKCKYRYHVLICLTYLLLNLKQLKTLLELISEILFSVCLRQFNKRGQRKRKSQERSTGHTECNLTGTTSSHALRHCGQ